MCFAVHPCHTGYSWPNSLWQAATTDTAANANESQLSTCLLSLRLCILISGGVEAQGRWLEMSKINKMELNGMFMF